MEKVRREPPRPANAAGIVDTGFPTLLVIGEHALEGMTPELMNGVAAGD